MIEQPVWLWYGDWNANQYNYIGENKKSDSCLATYEKSDDSSGDYCTMLFNLALYHLSMTYITVYNLSINSNYRILAAEAGAKLQVYPAPADAINNILNNIYLRQI